MQTLNLTLIFLFFEFCDFWLNKQNNIKDLIYSYVSRYAKSKILFFVTQFNFIYLSFCVFYLGFNSLLILYLLYVADVLTKLVFIKNILYENNPKSTVYDILNTNLQILPRHRIIVSSAGGILFFVLISL